MYFPPQTHLEVLEAEDVQDADGLEVLFAPDAAVESADDPVETLGVKCHGHGVPGVHRLHATRCRYFQPVPTSTLRVPTFSHRTENLPYPAQICSDWPKR